MKDVIPRAINANLLPEGMSHVAGEVVQDVRLLRWHDLPGMTWILFAGISTIAWMDGS